MLHDVRNKRSAEIGSDHYLLVSEINLRLSPNNRQQLIRRRNFDVAKLKVEATKNTFESKIAAATTTCTKNVDSMWEDLKKIIGDTCAEVLGYTKPEKKEWLTQEFWDLIELRKSTKVKLLSVANGTRKAELQREYKQLSRQIKRQTKRDKQSYYEKLGTAAQVAADKGDLKELYKISRDIAGKSNCNTVPVEDENGNLVTNAAEQMAIWKRYFDRTLNVIRNESNEQLLNVRRRNPNRSINCQSPSIEEIRDAILSLKTGKSSGNDNLPAEVFKAIPEVMSEKIRRLFVEVWNTERIPVEWKEAIIVKVPKKGDRKKCANWRGISLLPVINKIFTKIILNRIAEPLNKSIRPNQAGFRPAQSCVDHINTIRILIEQSVEFNTNMHLTFIDFEKAFDALKRDYVWKVLEARGIPPKIVNIVKSSYENATCRVLHNGELSDSILSTSGVRQGCALSPLLFITALDAVLETLDTDRYGINWGISNKLSDLEYADDVVFMTNTRANMQAQVTNVATECAKVGLNINIAKTKYMRINAPNESQLFINNTSVENVEKFEYLGSTVTINGGTGDDVANRLRKAKCVFANLKNIWRSATLQLNTKIKIFNACVKSVLLYGSESWFVTNAITQQLQTYVNRCLRQILRIWWPRTIRNEVLWKITNQQPIEKQIMKRKYGWLGHTLRKSTSVIAHTALEWNPQGRRNRGRPKSTWRRSISSETSKSFSELRAIARNRNNWKILVDRLSS